ncbi:IS66 family element%2C Orf2 protein [Shigella sonnei]|nr:IS66 family element%2C Orf2 protein [Shigella sonnei]
MISFPAGSRIWLVAGITDMRNGFNGPLYQTPGAGPLRLAGHP